MFHSFHAHTNHTHTCTCIRALTHTRTHTHAHAHTRTRELRSHLPPTSTSMYFTFDPPTESNTEDHCLPAFGSMETDHSGVVCFAGGPIWAMDWLPVTGVQSLASFPYLPAGFHFGRGGAPPPPPLPPHEILCMQSNYCLPCLLSRGGHFNKHCSHSYDRTRSTRILSKGWNRYAFFRILSQSQRSKPRKSAQSMASRAKDQSKF